MPLLLLFVAAFFSGILGASLSSFGLESFFCFIFFGLFIWKPKFSLIFLGFILGVLRVEIFEAHEPHDVPWNETITFEGEIMTEVDRRTDHQKVTLKTEWGRVLLTLSLYEDVEFGDVLTVEGRLEPAPEEEEDAYAYADYLALHRTWILMPTPSILSIQKAGPSFFSSIFDFKRSIETRIQSLYFEPEASFVAGLLLGSRKGLPDQLTLAFQRTGLSHIVAISGYNISLLVAALFYVLSFLDFKKRIILSSVGILIFVILVGASAAVLRAGLMGLLTLWGLYAGRKSQALFGLLWSALIMTLINPYTLIYDIGFQLSFAATLGILLFHPMLSGVLPEWKRFVWIRESLLLTLSAQITTTPFMLFYFGRFSLVSPVANLLVAPFIPLAMFFSGLSLLFGKTFAVAAWVYLKAVETVALVLGRIPFADFGLQISVYEFLISLLFLNFILIGFYKSTLLRAFGRDPAASFYKVRNQESERREKQ